MDFTFDDQQLQFRDAVRSFLVVAAAPEELRDFWETDEYGRSDEMRGKITEQGLTSLSVPESCGGMEQGDLDWVLLLQEVGYHSIPDSLSDAAYVGVGILNALSEGEFKTKWLQRMVEGRARIAISHPVNPLVHDAAIADLLLLWHKNEIHEASADQVTLTLNASVDQSRRLYKLEWTPSEETRICDAQQGAAIWAQAINRAAVSNAAQLLGLAQRMLDLGVDYSAERKQFGKPIGSFQAVKHHMADVAVKIEFARPVLHRAAYALQHGDERIDSIVSHAKLACVDAALLAARKSMQVHGAMGYTWEADLQMFMKRAWALDSYWGDRIFHKQRVADALFQAQALGPGSTF
ncbi:MAG: acyl-CoA dehydrogenase family protein [Oceanococcus sp.]